MLTFEQIKELIDLVATHRLSGIELERSGFRLQVDGYKVAPTAAATTAAIAAAPASIALPETPAAAAPPAPAPAAEAPPAKEAAAEVADDAHVVTSPIVGTFYRGPNPESPPFAEVGSRVKKGQVLCIIEAMKLMNEIESDADGVVVEVFPKNEQPVEFGERLFAVKTD